MTKPNKPYKKKVWRLQNIANISSSDKGVYAFLCRTNGKCVYVGQSASSIKNRLMQHWNGASSPPGLQLWIRAFGEHLDICYMPVESSKIDRTEDLLIQMWHPEINDLKQRNPKWQRRSQQ